MGTVGQGVRWEIDGDELVMRVDLRGDYGCTGRAGGVRVIARTGGFVPVVTRDGREVGMGLTVCSRVGSVVESAGPYRRLTAGELAALLPAGASGIMVASRALTASRSIGICSGRKQVRILADEVLAGRADGERDGLLVERRGKTLFFSRAVSVQAPAAACPEPTDEQFVSALAATERADGATAEQIAWAYADALGLPRTPESDRLAASAVGSYLGRAGWAEGRRCAGHGWRSNGLLFRVGETPP